MTTAGCYSPPPGPHILTSHGMVLTVTSMLLLTDIFSAVTGSPINSSVLAMNDTLGVLLINTTDSILNQSDIITNTVPSRGASASNSTTTTTIKATTTTSSITTITTTMNSTASTTTTTITTATPSSLASTSSTIPLSTTTLTSTVTSSVTSTAVTPNHPIPGWGLAIICLVVAAIVFALGWIFFVRYRRSKIPLARPAGSLFRKSTTVNRKTLDSGILVGLFEQTFKERSEKGEIQKEFEMIQEYSATLNQRKTRDVGQSEINQNRNRFIDIIPFDDNYVSLEAEQGMPPSTYVNASYIDNMDVLDKVIVTQGPKQNTVLDFWRLVVEKQCRHVIMLTNCQEQGRVKCFQYWPPTGQMLHFDHISLFTSEEKEVHPGLLLRKIELTHEDDEAGENVHVVRQLHLTNWPDHGVPDHINSILAFVKVASTFKDSAYSLVHCSAGVGRTGTYLALLSLTEQIQAGCGSIDVMETVLRLREKRPKMVQTAEQYNFLYQCLSVYIKRRLTGEDSVDTKILSDTVLDAGIDNFGFEHVKL